MVHQLRFFPHQTSEDEVSSLRQALAEEQRSLQEQADQAEEWRRRHQEAEEKLEEAARRAEELEKAAAEASRLEEEVEVGEEHNVYFATD